MTCPRCRQPALIRWSAPATHRRHGLPIAYPCMHWLTPKEGHRLDVARDQTAGSPVVQGGGPP